MWFAQDPTPLASPLATPLGLPPGITVETIADPSQALAGPKLVLLAIYFFIAIALIVCVTLRTSKADGLMQQSMSATPQTTAKGKMTGEERLSDLTNNLGYIFLFLSMVVASVVKI